MNIFEKIRLWLNRIECYAFKEKISVGKSVRFYQKLRLTGKGLIEIGDKSFFGYKIGGRFHGGSCEL